MEMSIAKTCLARSLYFTVGFSYGSSKVHQIDCATANGSNRGTTLKKDGAQEYDEPHEPQLQEHDSVARDVCNGSHARR